MLPVSIHSKSVAIACEHRTKRIGFGSFKRKHDGKKIHRYKCLLCGKTFSDSTFKENYKQKKPYLNPMIFHHLSGLMSQRRCASILMINRKTVVRKLIFMGIKAERFLIELNGKRPRSKSFQFDDLETFEHVWTHPGDARINLKIQTKKSRDAAMYPASFWSYAPGPDGLRAL